MICLKCQLAFCKRKIHISICFRCDEKEMKEKWATNKNFIISVSRCERDKAPLRVAMLLSGGVDSSLALSLVKMAGHHVTAFYLQIWFQEDFRNSWDACPWEEDLEYCRRVCERLDIPLQIVPLSEEYWDRVVHHSINEVKAGRTPNPDILCNSRVKFGAFYEYLNSNYAGTFDRVASGHYARAVRSNVQIENSNPVEHVDLMLTPDAVKDQTYFLSHLNPNQLEKVMFPIGVFTKDQVRELAHLFNLPNKSRKDSQGICFLGKVKFDEFVKEHLGEWRGPLVEEESNSVLGYHKGYWFYTPGQRKGIHLSGGPWYVTRKDIRNNVVFVSKNYNNVTTSEDVVLKETRTSFTCIDMNWIARDSLKERVFVSGHSGYIFDANHLQCKVRHGPKMYDCMVSALSFNPVDGEPDALHVELDGVDQGLASGQYAVFYTDSTCLGCGKIA